MNLEEFPKEYQRLVKQVQSIDWKAAEYLVDEAPKLPRFNPSYLLNACFVFKNTPQGLMHWRGVLKVLERERRGYSDLVQRIADLGVDQETIDYLNNEAMDTPYFNLSEHLEEAFSWKDTPQGFEFWEGIQERLESEEPPENQPAPLEPEPKEPVYPDMEAVQKRFFKLLDFKREHCPGIVFDPEEYDYTVYYDHIREQWNYYKVTALEEPTTIYFDKASVDLLVEKLNSGEFEL